MVGYPSGHKGADLKSAVPACIRSGRSNRSPIAIYPASLADKALVYGTRNWGSIPQRGAIIFDIYKKICYNIYVIKRKTLHSNQGGCKLLHKPYILGI